MAGGWTDAGRQYLEAELGKNVVKIRPWEDGDTPPPSKVVLGAGGADWGTVVWRDTPFDVVFETDARKERVAELRRLMDDWPPPSRWQRVRRWVRRVTRRGLDRTRNPR